MSINDLIKMDQILPRYYLSQVDLIALWTANDVPGKDPLQ